MILFFFGAILGCSLGIFFLALLMKSKETDESAWEVLREAPIMVEKNMATGR